MAVTLNDLINTLKKDNTNPLVNKEAIIKSLEKLGATVGGLQTSVQEISGILDHCAKHYFVTGASVDECDFTDIDYDDLQLGDVIVYTSNEDSTINSPYIVINKAEGSVILLGIIHTSYSTSDSIEYQVLFLENSAEGLGYSDDFSWIKYSNYGENKRYLINIESLTFETEHGSDYLYFHNQLFISSTLPSTLQDRTSLLNWIILQNEKLDIKPMSTDFLDSAFYSGMAFVSGTNTYEVYLNEGDGTSHTFELGNIDSADIEAIDLDTGERIRIMDA